MGFIIQHSSHEGWRSIAYIYIWRKIDTSTNKTKIYPIISLLDRLSIASLVFSPLRKKVCDLYVALLETNRWFLVSSQPKRNVACHLNSYSDWSCSTIFYTTNPVITLTCRAFFQPVKKKNVAFAPHLVAKFKSAVFSTSLSCAICSFKRSSCGWNIDITFECIQTPWLGIPFELWHDHTLSFKKDFGLDFYV